MIYKATSTFRVFSESKTLEELEKVLECKSDSGFSIGEPVSKKNPESSLQQSSLWTQKAEISSGEIQDAAELLDVALKTTLDKVEGLTTKLAALSDVRVDLYAGMFSDNEQVNCFVSHTTMQRMATLELDFTFSGYTTRGES